VVALFGSFLARKEIRSVRPNYTGWFIGDLFQWHIRNPNTISIIPYPSIAARIGGGSFKSEKIYESKEHVPIESFVTILID